MSELPIRKAFTRLRFSPRSLRWRLQLWQGFLVVSMMTGFGVSIYQLQRVNRFQQIDGDLETRVTALSRAVRDVYRDAPRHGPPPPFSGFHRHPPAPPPITKVLLPPATADLFGPGADGYYFVIWYRDGTVLNRSANAPSDAPRPARFERDTLPHFRTRGVLREAVHCSGLGDCAMTGRSIASEVATAHVFVWKLVASGVVVLILGFGLGWWLIGRAIRPLQEISGAAARIANGQLSERIRIADSDDELSHLAVVLNSTFSRLESAFVRQQQFTSDAAHELRTPLSILISEAQTTLARQRTAAEYRDTVAEGLETAQQMRRLTESLLDLARFDAADPAVSPSAADLAQVAGRCLERLQPLAKPKGVTVRRELASVLTAVSSERLDIVIGNLLANALFYNKQGGEVCVMTHREGALAVLEVSDTGIGIQPYDLPHVFDRFYRADKARSRAQGHAGLGLAISKTIAEAERGSIDVVSTPGKGTTFTVKFPCAAVL